MPDTDATMRITRSVTASQTTEHPTLTSLTPLPAIPTLPVTARITVTNMHLRDMLLSQDARMGDQSRTLAAHIEEDSRRHEEDRARTDHLLSEFELKIGVLISTHLSPFTDVLPTIQQVASDKRRQIERDERIDQRLANIQVVMGRGWKGMLTAVPLAAGIAGVLTVLAHIFHWW